MKFQSRIILICIVLILPCVISINAIDEILISKHKITLNVENKKLGSILDAVNKETGILISCDKGAFDKKISMRFSSLSQDEGIKRILSRTNYIIIYGADKNIKKIIVFGEDQTLDPETAIHLSAGTEKSISSHMSVGREIISMNSYKNSDNSGFIKVFQNRANMLPENMKVFSPSGEDIKDDFKTGRNVNIDNEGMKIFTSPEEQVGEGMKKNDSPASSIPEDMKVLSEKGNNEMK